LKPFRQFFTSIVIVIIFLFTSSVATASQLRFEVYARPMSNLIYQLDCMAQIFRCSSKVYEELWRKKLHWNSVDKDWLDQWKEVRLKYHQGEIKLDEPPTKPLALPWSGPIGIQLGDKFLIATYHATGRGDLRTRLETLVAPTDMETIDSALIHFEPRFMTWWKESAHLSLLTFQKELTKKVNQPEMRKQTEKFANFYDVKFPQNYPIYLNLFYRPTSDIKDTHATVSDNHAAIEVLSGEKVSNVLDVVIHEICHFFFSSSPVEKKRQLTEAFAGSNDPLALATYNILDEGIATAFGNGIAAEFWMDSKHFKERLEKERGFYNDAAIDAAAKSLLTVLKEDLNQEKTLFAPDFPDKAISALRVGMPDLIRAPARLLSELTTIYDPKFKAVVKEKVRRILRGALYSKEGLENNSSWEFLEKYPKLNAMLFVLPESLQFLKDRSQWIPQKDKEAIRSIFEKRNSFVYAIERYPSTYTFVIAGKSPDEVEKEFIRLFETKNRFIGLLP